MCFLSLEIASIQGAGVILTPCCWQKHCPAVWGVCWHPDLCKSTSWLLLGAWHCLRHWGWSFQAWHWPLLGEGVSFLAGASHGVWLLCKAPKDSGIYRWFSQVLPLQKLQSLPLGSGRAQKATRASGCSEGGEAQVLPHTALHESVWGAGKGRATGTH